MMGVNLDGCFFLAQAAIPHLLEQRGNIVNIASNAGLMGQAYTVAYCMSKGAIVQLTRALAMEYAKQPLRVNAIAPGGVDTALSRNFEIPDGLDFELMARYTGFGRWAPPTTSRPCSPWSPPTKAAASTVRSSRSTAASPPGSYARLRAVTTPTYAHSIPTRRPISASAATSSGSSSRVSRTMWSIPGTPQ